MSAVPDEMVVVYQQCESCSQNMPIDQFERRGRPRKDGTKPVDTICKHCREIKEKETRKYVRQNSKKLDSMQLKLLQSLADEPMDDFDDIPDVGTVVQHLLRPFGGMQGLSIQMASSYLSTPPGSTCRQKTHSLLLGMAKEASKLGYAKKPLELLSDDELEAYIEERARRTLSDASNEEVQAEEEAVAD